MSERTRLKVRMVNDILTITAGIDTIKWAAENHPEFWQPETDKFALKVSDSAKFAREVVRALTKEEEDGTTPVILLLDAAIKEAVEQGAEGLDFDHMERVQEAERIACLPESES